MTIFQIDNQLVVKATPAVLDQVAAVGRAVVGVVVAVVVLAHRGRAGAVGRPAGQVAGLGEVAFGGGRAAAGVAVVGQHAAFVAEGHEGRPSEAIMGSMMTQNLVIMGNCLGTSDDLTRALADWQAGKLAVPIDSVHRGDAIAAFVERTYVSPERLGKVVFRYEDPA